MRCMWYVTYGEISIAGFIKGVIYFRQSRYGLILVLPILLRCLAFFVLNKGLALIIGDPVASFGTNSVISLRSNTSALNIFKVGTLAFKSASWYQITCPWSNISGAVEPKENVEDFYICGTQVMGHMFVVGMHGVLAVFSVGGAWSRMWLFWRNSIAGPANEMSNHPQGIPNHPTR